MKLQMKTLSELLDTEPNRFKLWVTDILRQCMCIKPNGKRCQNKTHIACHACKYNKKPY